MAKLVLKAYKISHLKFKNTLVNGTKLELGNNYSYNVKYGQNNICEGFLKIEVKDKNGNENFLIELTVQGIFQSDGSMKREELHVATFKELFPYARVFISNLTVTAGMPPINIPPIDMEKQEIYRIDMRPDAED
ncbi:MAG: protein-export chaperone SecB [Clostridia bacterium]|nr:protein-export chaperone SecB [Clostridia bacterium]